MYVLYIRENIAIFGQNLEHIWQTYICIENRIVQKTYMENYFVSVLCGNGGRGTISFISFVLKVMDVIGLCDKTQRNL